MMKKMVMHEVMMETSELRPGMFIKLDHSWRNHPFLLNQFLLKTADDVKKVQNYVKKISVLPGKSKIPIFVDDEEPGPNDVVVDEIKPKDLTEAQKKLTQIRQGIINTQSKYVESVKKSSKAFELMDTLPAESMRDLKEVITSTVETISIDPNSAINLVLSAGSSQTEVAHGLSVMTTSLVLGRAIGLNSQALEVVATGAILHDIGKRSIPSEVLINNQRSPIQEEVYRRHCKYGVEILKSLNLKSQGVYDAVLYHHEHFEGGGYPYGIGGTQIPLTARIVAICERFDRLTNMHDPEKSLTPSHALGRMFKAEKGWFDSALLGIFIKKMGVYPPGTLVELSDGRSAVVMIASDSDSLRPQVMVYEKGIKKADALILDLEAETRINIVKAIKSSDLDPEALDFLLPRRNITYFLSNSY